MKSDIRPDSPARKYYTPNNGLLESMFMFIGIQDPSGTTDTFAAHVNFYRYAMG
jgi:hypothetical protein